jgi:hypothetical protein
VRGGGFECDRVRGNSGRSRPPNNQGPARRPPIDRPRQCGGTARVNWPGTAPREVPPPPNGEGMYREATSTEPAPGVPFKRPSGSSIKVSCRLWPGEMAGYGAFGLRGPREAVSQCSRNARPTALDWTQPHDPAPAFPTRTRSIQLLQQPSHSLHCDTPSQITKTKSGEGESQWRVFSRTRGHRAAHAHGPAANWASWACFGSESIDSSPKSIDRGRRSMETSRMGEEAVHHHDDWWSKRHVRPVRHPLYLSPRH